MAFFKRRPFRGRSNFSRFRRRGGFGTRPGKEPQKWEVSDFAIGGGATLPAGAGSETIALFHLLSVGISLSQGTDNLNVGNALAAMTRKIHVGGIVFDYNLFPQNDIEGVDDIFEGNVLYRWFLCYDNLVADPSLDWIPNSVQAYSPLTSDFPTAILNNAVAPSPEASTREGFRPVRVLWQKNDMLQLAARRFNNDEEGVLYVPSDQRVITSRGTVNRRLRVSLGDHQGLFLGLATLNLANFAAPQASRVIHRFATGSIYWRWGF